MSDTIQGYNSAEQTPPDNSSFRGMVIAPVLTKEEDAAMHAFVDLLLKRFKSVSFVVQTDPKPETDKITKVDVCYKY